MDIFRKICIKKYNQQILNKKPKVLREKTVWILTKHILIIMFKKERKIYYVNFFHYY